MAAYSLFKNYLLEPLTATQPAKTKPVTTKLPQISFLNAFSKVIRTKQVQNISMATDAAPMVISQRKDIKLTAPNLIQGHNECGPTSLAMILQYYGINPGDYHNMFASDTVGHGPLALKRVAENRNCLVRQKNNGTLQDLVSLIDQGIPVQVLGIYGGGTNSSLSAYIDNASRAHWMVATGYKKDDAGNITHIYFNNPNQSTTQCWTASDFLTKFWNNNIIPGGHRYYLATAKRGLYQESALQRIMTTDQFSDTFATTVSVIDGLERAFYAAEDIADEISSWFS
jgi:hypothetical protein